MNYTSTLSGTFWFNVQAQVGEQRPCPLALLFLDTKLTSAIVADHEQKKVFLETKKKKQQMD